MPQDAPAKMHRTSTASWYRWLHSARHSQLRVPLSNRLAEHSKTIDRIYVKFNLVLQDTPLTLRVAGKHDVVQHVPKKLNITHSDALRAMRRQRDAGWLVDAVMVRVTSAPSLLRGIQHVAFFFQQHQMGVFRMRDVVTDYA